MTKYRLNISATDFNDASVETFDDFNVALNSAIGEYSNLAYNDLSDLYSQGNDVECDMKLEVKSEQNEEGEVTKMTFMVTSSNANEPFLFAAITREEN